MSTRRLVLFVVVYLSPDNDSRTSDRNIYSSILLQLILDYVLFSTYIVVSYAITLKLQSLRYWCLWSSAGFLNLWYFVAKIDHIVGG